MQYAGVNFIDTYFRYATKPRALQGFASRSDSLWYRSGLYKPAFFPLPIAGEVSGIIVELPTDQALLESETYKSRGFKKGGKVALVLFHNICTALRSLLHRSDYVLIEHQGLSERICCCAMVGLDSRGYGDTWDWR